MTDPNLNNTPRMVHPYFQRSNRSPATHRQARAAGSGPWSIADLCAAYKLPTKLAIARTTTIAIIELGGGYAIADVEAASKANGIPTPTIVDVSVDGTKNTPGGDADVEVALDIQVASVNYSYATGEPANVRIYWCQDIAAGVRAATKDGVTTISISWGADEAEWGKGAGEDMEAAAAAAKAAGIPVFAAAGDNDSSDGGPGKANVDLPASAPSVIGCGGTSKSRTAESVWNNNPGKTDGSGTGGGYSNLFAASTWQVAGGAPKGPGGRMVPDVAACADPDTGYEIIVNGETQVVGGTSAVAPLYAGLFAALLGSVASSAEAKTLAETLWSAAGRACFVDITKGNNGEYSAGVGPDPCTGLGAPIGSSLETLLATKPTKPIAPPIAAPIKPTPNKPLPPSSNSPVATPKPTRPGKHKPVAIVGDGWIDEAAARRGIEPKPPKPKA